MSSCLTHPRSFKCFDCQRLLFQQIFILTTLLLANTDIQGSSIYSSYATNVIFTLLLLLDSWNEDFKTRMKNIIFLDEHGICNYGMDNN